VVTKSGTMQWHGGVWEFNRNNKTQSRNFFDRDSRGFPCDKSDPSPNRKACAPQYNQNQYGGNLGGPVPFLKYTFFFVNEEEYWQRRGGSTVTQVMMPDQRNGDFSRFLQTATTTADAMGRTFRRGQLFDPRSSRQVTAPNGQLQYIRDPYPGNIIPKDEFDPVAAKMVANTTFMPLPNAPGQQTATGDIINNYIDSRSSKLDSDQVTARIDHQFTASDTLYGRFSFQDSRQYTPRTFPGFGAVSNVRNINVSVSYTKVLSPRTVGEFRFGHQGWYETSGAEDGIAGNDWITTFNIPGMDVARASGNKGSPDVNITGYASLGNGTGPFSRRNKTYQPLAILSFSQGRHFMKAGGELRWVKIDSIGPAGGDGGTRGSFNYDDAAWTGIQGVPNTGNTAAAFLQGLARQKTRLVGDFKLGYTAREWGAFFQDDFKVSSNLTLNFGVRYMYYTPPYDDRNAISSWLYPTHCPSYTVCGPNYLNLPANSPYQTRYGIAGVDLPRSLAPTDYKDFSPRVGFAFRPFGGDSTVLRGGYGIFYTSENAYNTTYSGWVQPFAGLFYWHPTPYYWNPTSAPGNPLFDGQQHFTTLDQKPYGLDYVQGTSLGFFFPTVPNYPTAYVEQYNLTLGRELPGRMAAEIAYVGSRGVNLNGPSTIFNYDPNLLTKVQTANPSLSNFGLRTKGFNSFYNALQTSLRKEASHGISFLAAYTWSHALTDMSNDDTNETLFTDTTAAGNIITKRLANADFDYRQRFTFSGTWALPFGRGRAIGSSWNGIADVLAGGWQTSAIVTFQGGFPFTVYDSALHLPDRVCSGELPKDQRSATNWIDYKCFPTHQPTTYVDPVTGQSKQINIQGNSPPNAIFGPGTNNWDLSAEKNFRLTERFNLQFRGEFFNAFNHMNLQAPSGNYFINTPSGVQITRAANTRDIQFALRLSF